MTDFTTSEVVSGSDNGQSTASEPEINVASGAETPENPNSNTSDAAGAASESSSQSSKAANEAGDGAASESKETDAPEEAAVEAEATVDDDPFAEYEAEFPVTKDKSYYEELFKTEKWRTVPHTARNEIFSLIEQIQSKNEVISSIGGQEIVPTIKPFTEMLTTSAPSREQIQTAFDSLNNHNPQIMEDLGGLFTENFVNGVLLAEPEKVLGPIMQRFFERTFASSEYDLPRICELIQLDLAVDSDGMPLLDVGFARDQFKRMGGIPTFQYQRELAALKAEREKWVNGQSQGRGQENADQQNLSGDQTAKQQQDSVIETEIGSSVFPKVEGFMAKLGYKQGDPLYDLVRDATLSRIRSAAEMQNIRNFASKGDYKTPEGKFTQGVLNNQKSLSDKIFAKVFQEMKTVQSALKGNKAAVNASNRNNSQNTNVKSNSNSNSNEAFNNSTNFQKSASSANGQADLSGVKSIQDYAAVFADRARARMAEERAALKIASGR